MSGIYKKTLLVCIILLLAFSPMLPANAQQSGWKIRVSMVSTLERPDEMALKVYFSVYDPKTSLPVLNIKPKSSSIGLPQSNFTAETSVTEPDVPIYIVLVMDASGSMSGAAANLKKAAKLGLNNTPNKSLFSVVQFDEEIKLIQDFTENIPAVSYAIDQYKVVGNKGTCLYDAAYTSIESLQKAPPGRRAVILFTDGKDENTVGKVCSKHTYQELSDFAQKAQIPINTIGLSYAVSKLNEVELKGIAASTGGYSAIAKEGEASMSAAFQNIMDGLKAQWMVSASIYPKKGSNQVVLTLNLEDGQMLGDTFSVESSTDYPGPPSPVRGRLAGLEFRPQNLTYDIQLSSTSPELVEYVKIEVWDVKGGSKVSEYQFKDIQANNTFNVPTGQLVIGRDYELRMTAISKEDGTRFAWFTNQDGKKTTELLHAFVFDPTASLPALDITSGSQQSNDLILEVKTTNSQLIGGFDGWVVDDQTGTKFASSEFTSPALPSDSGNVTMPLSKINIPDGKYIAIVRVLGKDNQEYSKTEFPFIYKRVYPSLSEQLIKMVIAAPMVIALIVAILLGLVGFMMYSSSREKSLTGTPVLQGRLGGKSGRGHSSGAVIPIATDEPIPPRGQHPGDSPPAAKPPAPVATKTASNPAAAAQNITLISTATTQPRAFLTVVDAGGSAAPQGTIWIMQFPFVIGRVEGELIIPEPNISRRHAQITYDESSRTFSISDLGSSNGTRLDNQKLFSGQPTPLSNGALIGLGPKVIIKFGVA